MNLSPHSPFSSKASQLLSWGHWFTFANIGLVLLISSSYLFADKSPTSLLGWFYMVITWISHTSFITFSAFVLTIFPLSMVFPYPRHIRGMAAIIATVGICVLSLDAFVYFQLGYHLNFSSLSDIITVLGKTIVSSPIITAIISIGFMVFIFALELIAGNHAWRHLDKLKCFKFPRYATGLLVSCFAMSHSIHIWADANAYFDITKQDNVLPLSYPTTAKKLLARHDLLDIEHYQQATEIHFDNSQNQYQIPHTLPSCKSSNEPVTVIYFENQSDLKSFTHNKPELVSVPQLIQPSDHQDALFNLAFGLPAYYQTANNSHPSWDPDSHILTLQHSDIVDSKSDKNTSQALISIINGSQNAIDYNKQGYYFAFSLADLQSDVVFSGTYYTNVPSLQKVMGFKQLQDITYTLLSTHFTCAKLAEATMIARNLTHSRSEGVNFTQGVLVALKKDRITLVKRDGSYEHISGAEGFAIEQKLDVPFLIQSIKTLKKFSVDTSTK
ncbi:hypothetical protein PCIT_a2907 [Pseudoalteromonas citrea]|uniref:Inner membrane protein YejM N-terminal domain-containing protein n=2 Tax=Pseudoalteromonas citrea TaxID=43655 RepID=A0AAD4FRM0_9GAMM|nr:DUF3413 domain-containing protein [Pseudoalteromonas citrea]KAF7769975.1 hypothetical protein PCIT_a2907 [Pseudoalteromonas citrea]